MKMKTYETKPDGLPNPHPPLCQARSRPSSLCFVWDGNPEWWILMIRQAQMELGFSAACVYTVKNEGWND